MIRFIRKKDEKSFCFIFLIKCGSLYLSRPNLGTKNINLDLRLKEADNGYINKGKYECIFNESNIKIWIYFVKFVGDDYKQILKLLLIK